jgi:purine-nucleoside phosphorylase
MSDIPPELATKLAIVDKAQHELNKPDQRLNDAVANCEKRGLPAISIGPAQGAYLSILCQLTGAKSVLEIGTLGKLRTFSHQQQQSLIIDQAATARSGSHKVYQASKSQASSSTRSTAMLPSRTAKASTMSTSS